SRRPRESRESTRDRLKRAGRIVSSCRSASLQSRPGRRRAWKLQRRPVTRRPDMPPAAWRPTRSTDATVPFLVVVELREPVTPNEVAPPKPYPFGPHDNAG